jgi:hypothetical protein
MASMHVNHAFVGMLKLGHQAGQLSQQAGKHIGKAAITSKDWVVDHPGQTAGMVSCVAAAPLAMMAAPVVLGAAGFSASGVVAGKFSLGGRAVFLGLCANQALLRPPPKRRSEMS